MNLQAISGLPGQAKGSSQLGSSVFCREGSQLWSPPVPPNLSVLSSGYETDGNMASPGSSWFDECPPFAPEAQVASGASQGAPNWVNMGAPFFFAAPPAHKGGAVCAMLL